MKYACSRSQRQQWRPHAPCPPPKAQPVAAHPRLGHTATSEPALRAFDSASAAAPHIPTAPLISGRRSTAPASPRVDAISAKFAGSSVQSSTCDSRAGPAAHSSAANSPRLLLAAQHHTFYLTLLVQSRRVSAAVSPLQAVSPCVPVSVRLFSLSLGLDRRASISARRVAEFVSLWSLGACLRPPLSPSRRAGLEPSPCNAFSASCMWPRRRCVAPALA